MLTQIFNVVLVFSFSISLLSCKDSPIGPNIGGRGLQEGETDPDNGGSDSPGGGTDDLSCARTSGHNVYYFGSNISLNYTCTTAATTISSTNPAFLSSSLQGATVSFTGTAPTTASSDSWTFSINNLTTSGDSAAITTKVISTAGLSAALPATADLANNNNTEVSISHISQLDAAWDGAMSDVSLTATSMSTDMHGLNLYDACDTAAVPYLCNGSSTADESAKSISQSLKLRWRWSAFDQGDYYLSVSPRLTVEGSAIDLAEDTLAFTIPMQAAGNAEISHASNLEEVTYRDIKYSYSAAISKDSTATNPAVGLIYVANDSSHSSFFKRIAVDRTDDPDDAGSDGVTESGELVVSSGNSSDFTVRALSGGSWATLGAIATAGGKQDVRWNKVSNSATVPASEASVSLTNFDATNSIAGSVDMTKPFVDGDGQTRLGFAFVRNDTVSGIRYLTVAKANPSGTTAGTIVDDGNYGADPADFEIAGANNTVDIDRVKIRHTTESGTGYFYVAYRQDTDIKVTRLLSSYSGGHGATSAVLAAGVFADSGTTNYQSLDFALGVKGGATVVGAVYRRNADGVCYFKKFDSALTSTGNALALTNSQCYFPTIHYNAASGRFVATFAQRNDANNYDIVKTEISLRDGADDAKSASVVLVETGAATPPIKLVSDFYQDGNWMAILYRKFGANVLSFHGYHVSDR